MKTYTKLWMVVLVVFALATGSSVYAGTVTVGIGAFSNNPVITFESLSDGTAVTNQYSGANGVTFRNLWADDSFGPFFFADAGHVSANNFNGPGHCCLIPSTMNFSAMYSLVGFEIVSNGMTTFTVTGFDNQTNVFNINARPSASSGIFVGFQNAGGISQISFGPSANGNPYMLDNIRLEGAISTPEPASLFLLGTGLLALLGGQALRKRS